MTKRKKPSASAQWPAYRVVPKPLSWLKLFERNPKKHPDSQVKALRAAIDEWGWTYPVLATSDGEIIVGHGRVLAARLEPALSEAPVIIASGWSKAQITAYRIADNKLAELGSWDQEMLRAEMGELQIARFDLTVTGFSVPELAQLRIEGYSAPIADRADVIPKKPIKVVVRAGDLWTLGDHRLLVGDNTRALNVARLMNGQAADLVFTSPPYAQQRDYGAAKDSVSDWDKLMQGTFAALPASEATQVLVNLGLVHRAGEFIPYWDNWIVFMRDAGWKRFGWYVWDQGPGLQGDWHGRLAPAFEFIFHFNKTIRRPNKTADSKLAGVVVDGGLRQKDGVMQRGRHRGPSAIAAKKIPDSVIRVMRHKGALPGDVGSHPAVFPVQLPREIIGAYSEPGASVYDPFVGSGTTVIAAQMDGRRCYAMEIDAAYAQIVIERWQKFTEGVATREDGVKLATLLKMPRQRNART